jgi:hypothetical protein
MAVECRNNSSKKYGRILGPKLSRPPRNSDYWNYTVLFFFPDLNILVPPNNFCFAFCRTLLLYTLILSKNSTNKVHTCRPQINL